MDRSRFQLVHEDTVYVQGCIAFEGAEALFTRVMAYPPCWAVLDPGMTLDPHHHPIPEFYIFTNGCGTMRVGDRTFPVSKDVSVYIPPDEVHTVDNPVDASEPLVWISIGLKEAPSKKT